MGQASLTNQVTRLLNTAFREGRSRHEAKAEGTAGREIHSYNTLRTYRQRVLTVLNAIPEEQRPRLLRDLTPEHIEAAVETLRERGAGDAHIKTCLAALRKMATLMHARQWHSLTAEQLVRDSLYNDLARPAARGGYTSEQVAQIRAAVGQRSRGDELVRLLDLLAATGLRHNEAVRLREADIDRQAGVITVSSSNAKGGRQRVIGPDLDAAGRAALRTAIDAIPTGRNWLWTDGPALGRRLQDEIRSACATLRIDSKGLHGLRGTFAEQFLRRRIASGLVETAARRELTRLLGHNRIDVTYRYVPPLS